MSENKQLKKHGLDKYISVIKKNYLNHKNRAHRQSNEALHITGNDTVT